MVVHTKSPLHLSYILLVHTPYGVRTPVLFGYLIIGIFIVPLSSFNLELRSFVIEFK